MCTTVAIAIVAETCLPFTVLPALMNEYRVPELNVQNGVLKVSPAGGLKQLVVLLLLWLVNGPDLCFCPNMSL